MVVEFGNQPKSVDKIREDEPMESDKAPELDIATLELGAPSDDPFVGPPAPTGTPVQFEIFVAGEKHETFVWATCTRYEESIPDEVISECACAMETVENALAAVGISKPSGMIKLMMTAPGRQAEEVGPAVCHIPFQAERYADSPHKYWRAPRKVTPELLIAMMRSHNAILAREAAEAEYNQATESLHALQVEAGVYDPAYYE